MFTVAGAASSLPRPAFARLARLGQLVAAPIAFAAMAGCSHAAPSRPAPAPVPEGTPAANVAPVPAMSVLAGRVTAEETTRPIADADVSIPDLGRTARSDSAGLFAITAIPRGVHVVVVRRLGYDEVSSAIEFSGTDTLARMFLLPVRTLPTRATDPVDTAYGSADRFRDFHRRQARGIGRFIVHDQFVDEENQQLSEVIRKRIPGLSYYRNTRNGGIAIATSRGVPPLGAVTGGEGYPPACYAQLFVDGVRVFSSESGRTPVSINDFRATEIEAIEFYPSPDQTPPELTGAGAVCGTIVLWTRID